MWLQAEVHVQAHRKWGGGEGRGGEGAYFHRNFEMLAKSKKN